MAEAMQRRGEDEVDYQLVLRVHSKPYELRANTVSRLLASVATVRAGLVATYEDGDPLLEYLSRRLPWQTNLDALGDNFLGDADAWVRLLQTENLPLFASLPFLEDVALGIGMRLATEEDLQIVSIHGGSIETVLKELIRRIRRRLQMVLSSAAQPDGGETAAGMREALGPPIDGPARNLGAGLVAAGAREFRLLIRDLGEPGVDVLEVEAPSAGP